MFIFIIFPPNCQLWNEVRSEAADTHIHVDTEGNVFLYWKKGKGKRIRRDKEINLQEKEKAKRIRRYKEING